jgi:hypothetical protein
MGRDGANGRIVTVHRTAGTAGKAGVRRTAGPNGDSARTSLPGNAFSAQKGSSSRSVDHLPSTQDVGGLDLQSLAWSALLSGYGDGDVGVDSYGLAACSAACGYALLYDATAGGPFCSREPDLIVGAEAICVERPGRFRRAREHVREQSWARSG